MTKLKFISVLLVIAIISMITGCAGTGTFTTESLDALRSGNYNKAIEDFKSCVDSEGSTGDWASVCSFMLGKAYFDKGQYPEAITYLKRAIDVYKKGMYIFHLDYAWHFWLGRAYLENNQYREAIVCFEKAASIAVENPGSLFPAEYTGLRTTYLPLIPPKSGCYFWLGTAYHLNDQYQEAVNALKRAIELEPTATDFYTTLAAAYNELKQYDDAVAAVKRSIEIKPNDFFAYGVLGNIYSDQKKYNDAIDAYKKAIEFNPKGISLYFNLSNLYSAKEDYASAIAINQKAQAMAPENADIPFAIASLYMFMGKFDEAINSLNKAISLRTITGVGLEVAVEENYPVVKSLMEGPAKRADVRGDDKIKGWDGNKVAKNIREAEGSQVVLTIERKNLDRPVEKTVTREAVISEKAAAPLAQRSLAHREKGNLEKFYKDAEKAYSLDPNNDGAKKSLGAVYIDKGKYDDAIKMLSTTQKDDSFARILEAIAYAKSGDMKKAVEIYSSIPEDYLVSKNALRQSYKKALLESLKSYAKTRKDSAKSLEAKGQYREALKEYAEALKIADDNEAKEIRNDIAKLIKKNPYFAELPEEARRHVMRAEVLTKEGKFDDAVKEYREAIRIAPYFSMLYKAIALNYAELKQYRQAIDNLKTYLDLSPDAPDVRQAKDEIYKWEFMMEKGGK